ncbi:Autoinducer 2 sensor kinase/phosphatase LuxQ [compost metagenome]
MQWLRNIREKVTFGHLFLFNQLVLTLVLLGVLVVFGVNLYASEQVSLREKFEPLLSREVERFNNDFVSLEGNVEKLKIFMDLYDIASVRELNKKIKDFTAKTLAPHPMQYNAFFAYGPELSRRYFNKDAYILTIHRDYSLYGTEKYLEPESFVAQTFIDQNFINDPTLEWWFMNKVDQTISYSHFYFDKGYMEKVMFTTATGLFKSGRLMGAVGIDTLASDFSSRLDSFQLGKTGGLMVVDGYGRPILPLIGTDSAMIGYHHKRAANEKEFNSLPTFSEKIFDVQGYGLKTFHGEDGVKYLTISKSLKGRPWHLVLYQQRNEAFTSLYSKVFVVLATSLGAYVALSFLLWLSWKYMVFRNDQAFLALTEARDRAEAATKAKSAFLSTMSHEIRTPLNAMLGVTELLSETGLDREQRHYVRTLQGAGDSLLSVLNNVLDFSKIESGNIRLEILEFRMSDLVREIHDLCSISAQKKNLELVVKNPPFDELVRGDFHRIKQVLLNLIGNAIKFTPRGKIELSVETTESSDMTLKSYKLGVRDTGVGISKDNLNHIFDDFSQEDSSITRRFGGTGLGLSISRKLVKLMGADIQCESQLQVGSQFYFSLMLEGQSIGPWAYVNKEVKKIEPHMASAQILIVDDMEDNHSLIKAYLKNIRNVTTESVYDGDTCLHRLRTADYSLILMDVQMPNMDGLETIRRLRERERSERRPRTPIVVISANSFREDIEKSLIAGADEHCGKPLRKETLLSLVEKYCSLQKNDVIA